MKKYIFCWILFILIIFLVSLKSAVAADFSINDAYQLTSNPYKGELVNFKATVYADSGNYCGITCQYILGSDSGYVSDSGNPPPAQLSYGNYQEFPFSIRAEGENGLISQDLTVRCDRIANYLNCWPGSETHILRINFNFSYPGDGICTANKEKCATYQNFIGTNDCACSADKECRPDGNRSVDEKGCQGFCGNKIYEPPYEDCSCSSDYTCPATKQCKVEGRAKDSNGCTSFCGNGICDKQYENCTNCANDCGQCSLMPCTKNSECSTGYCVWNTCWNTPFRKNDSHCDSTKSENCANSPEDCRCSLTQKCNSGGFCETYCGNGVCEFGEVGKCKLDCKWCGDGVCQITEGCASCEIDCGYCKQNQTNPTNPNNAVNNSNYEIVENITYEIIHRSGNDNEEPPIDAYIPSNEFNESLENINASKKSASSSAISSYEKAIFISIGIVFLILVIIFIYVIFRDEKNYIYCPNCNRKIEANSKYCINCGQRIV